MPSTKEYIEATLAGLQDEIEHLKGRLQTLEEREATLRAWVAEEAPTQTNLPIHSANGGTNLASFLQLLLSDGKPRALREIVNIVVARGGLVRQHTKPGRAIHFALLGLQNRGHVERGKDRAWVAKK